MKYHVPKGKAKMKIYLEKEVVAVNLEKLKVFYKRVSKKLDRIIAETSEEVMRGQSVEDLGEDLDDLDDGEEGEEEDGEGEEGGGLEEELENDESESDEGSDDENCSEGED